MKQPNDLTTTTMHLPTTLNNINNINKKNKKNKKKKAAAVAVDSNGDLTTRDVICAGGRTAWQHPGNQTLQRLINATLNEYSAAETKLKKGSLVSLVIRGIHLNGGRFLRRDKPTLPWEIVTSRVVREKIGQLFRNGLHDRYLSSAKNRTKAAKEIRQQNRHHPQRKQAPMLPLTTSEAETACGSGSANQPPSLTAASSSSSSSSSCWSEPDPERATESDNEDDDRPLMVASAPIDSSHVLSQFYDDCVRDNESIQKTVSGVVNEVDGSMDDSDLMKLMDKANAAILTDVKELDTALLITEAEKKLKEAQTKELAKAFTMIEV